MSTDNVKIIRLKPHSTTHTKTDTIEVTQKVIASWKAPPFQRPLKVNQKVTELATKIEEDGVIPGVITLGVLGKDTYLLDGQHRVHAFTLADLPLGYVDVRVHHFKDMGEMGEEFVNVNSRLVNFKPDDILRGLEESTSVLRLIKSKCSFVGYDMIRRGDRSPMVSMSMLLRTWAGSAAETPAPGGDSALNIARVLTSEEAETICIVLKSMESAWGRDNEYARLWAALNMSLCFWLYRRTVIAKYSTVSDKITKDLFTKCLMSVSADSAYLDWLVGRKLSERDRSPAFTKLKVIFAKRIETETGKKPKLPSPAWSKSH
jgi:hypothetical protein